MSARMTEEKSEETRWKERAEKAERERDEALKALRYANDRLAPAESEVHRLREENAALRAEVDAVRAALRNFELNGADAAAQIRGVYTDFDATAADLRQARADLAKAQQQVRLIASDSDARAATWAEALAAVRADSVELRTALRRLEWSGPIRNGATTCPACRHDRGNGHGESCWLVGLLVAP